MASQQILTLRLLEIILVDTFDCNTVSEIFSFLRLPATHEVIFDHRIFRTLDYAPHSCIDNQSQHDMHSIPSGFKIAAIYDKRIISEVIAAYSWGCCALIVELKNDDGNTYNPAYRTGNLTASLKGLDRSGQLWDSNVQLSYDGNLVGIHRSPSYNQWNYQRKILLQSIDKNF